MKIPAPQATPELESCAVCSCRGQLAVGISFKDGRGLFGLCQYLGY